MGGGKVLSILSRLPRENLSSQAGERVGGETESKKAGQR